MANETNCPDELITMLDAACDDVPAYLQSLRDKLSPDGSIVSPRGRELTEKVFGRALTPQEVVRTICDDVRQRGVEAVLHYTRQLDGVELTAETLRVPEQELARAHRAVPSSFLQTIDEIREQLEQFQSAIKHQDVSIEPRPGVQLRQRYTPLRRIGICVPGGAAAYPSTVLMTAVPAIAAGVPQCVVVAPPTRFGSYNEHVLATCHAMGIREVYRVGGAQAVAAMAFGLAGMPAVDKIVGPGNLFVALAKKYVFGQVDIDSIAGPSEVVVIADQTANPAHLAADLLAQAEHSPGSAVLFVTDRSVALATVEWLERHLRRLDRADLTLSSLREFSAVIRVEGLDQAIEWTQMLAPEHLHLQTAQNEAIIPKLTNAGAIFDGEWTPVALGDYVAGPSHVLPTGATARWASGLSSNDFLRSSSVVRYSRPALEREASLVRKMTEEEHLPAHRLSVDVRLTQEAGDE